MSLPHQVSKWHKDEKVIDKYDSRIIKKIPEGPGAREKILKAETENAKRLIDLGQLRDLRKHQRPRDN